MVIFNNIANIFGYVLNYIYQITGNYGIAIIIFTLFYKIILLPITYFQRRSNQKTMSIQGKQQEIKEKYKDNEKKINEETLKLYKENNISPFVGCIGCLGLIFNLVFVLSMFTLVNDPLRYMKKIDESKYLKCEVKMYKEELAKKEIDTEIDENKEITNKELLELRKKTGINRPQLRLIKRYKDEDSDFNINVDFLGLNLAEAPIDTLKTIDFGKKEDYEKLKVLAIPVIYISFTVFNLILMKKRKDNTIKEDKKIIEIEAIKKNENENENNSIDKIKKDDNGEEILDTENALDAMKDANGMMTYFMPVMMFLVTVSSPQALGLYWMLQSIISIAENEILRVIIDKKVKTIKE